MFVGCWSCCCCCVEMEEGSLRVLGKYWGYCQLRSCQLSLCQSILGGRDLFVSMPHASGKSLASLLPSILLTEEGTPSFSLILNLSHSSSSSSSSSTSFQIEEQVKYLRSIGISAASRSIFRRDEEKSEKHGLGKRNREEKEEREINNNSILILTIEQFRDHKNDIKYLSTRKKFVSIILENYSSQYHRHSNDQETLSQIKAWFPQVSIIVLTNHSNPSIISSVVTQLQLASPHILRTSLNRSNIYYSVKYYQQRIFIPQYIAQFYHQCSSSDASIHSDNLMETPSSLIFVKSTIEAEALLQLLIEYKDLKKLQVIASFLIQEPILERKEILKKFYSEDIQILILLEENFLGTSQKSFLFLLFLSFFLSFIHSFTPSNYIFFNLFFSFLSQ